MSPEYNKVRIRPEKEKEFEDILGKLGGTYEGKRVPQEELRETAGQVWSKQRASAECLLDKFKHPTDPKAQSVINMGVTRLITYVFGDFNDLEGFYWRRGKKMRTKHEVDWELTKDTLVGIFEENLPEALPPDVILAPDQRSLTRLPSYKSGFDRILPKHIETLIRFYGLDGITRSHEQVAQEQGLSKSTIRDVIERTKFSCFLWDKNLSAVFLEPVPR